MTQESGAWDWRKLEASAAQPTWIRDSSTLATYCERWRQLPMVALDTEFMRVDTFYPRPGLIQLSDQFDCYLIDPLSIEDFSAFVELLADSAVLKVVHAGSEDLELFLNSYGVLPEPLFDTQVAAAFAGWGFSMGLQRLVAHALDVQLGKGETTSDWLQRPLTPEQEHYAALDVAYLPAIALELQAQLKQLQRLDWVLEECADQRLSVIDTDPEGLAYYQRFSQVWNISDVKRAGLRDLTAWRERAARARDIPRNRLLRNQHLLAIIERWPTTLQALGRVPEIRRKVVREDGEAILACLLNAEQSAIANPPAPIQRPLHYAWNKRIKALKAIGREVAEDQSLAVEVLLRKRDIDALIQSRDEQGGYSLPPALQGWRRPLVGERLLARLNEFERES
ncbi:ribonuclease D [Marinobacterium zhoushanense]|uniref:Ribonuclease D n=1 Tax=Marinobacterium zhoushanense TaxID=1679163 RepID=A0ABQ1JW84_9GAMM|nr:ribonuclease D [Marinobacterium zhoushanense]GGB80026.1 ribonuclease D [Marinobacterium zhoushanense]